MSGHAVALQADPIPTRSRRGRSTSPSSGSKGRDSSRCGAANPNPVVVGGRSASWTSPKRACGPSRPIAGRSSAFGTASRPGWRTRDVALRPIAAPLDAVRPARERPGRSRRRPRRIVSETQDGVRPRGGGTLVDVAGVGSGGPLWAETGEIIHGPEQEVECVGIRRTRILARGKEFATRVALGAPRGRIVAQVLSEVVFVGSERGPGRPVLIGAVLLRHSQPTVPAPLPDDACIRGGPRASATRPAGPRAARFHRPHRPRSPRRPSTRRWAGHR